MDAKTFKEEWAIVLDFLPNGKVSENLKSYGTKPVAQVLGVNTFVLLEVVPRDGTFLNIGEKVYVGSGKRDKVAHILGRISFDSLTSSAQKELQFVIPEIVRENESVFVKFFNTALPLTTRKHQLELLPGLGKKHMWQIIDEREVEPFKNFDDIRSRVPLIQDPVKTISKRIFDEISKEQKHYLFVNKS